MKSTFRSFVALATLALLAVAGTPVLAELPEPNRSAKMLTNMVSVTSRDQNIVTTELKKWVSPKKHEWLDAKSSDLDPLFMHTALAGQRDNQIAGITKMNHGGGSGGISYHENGGGGQFIDQLKAGRFVGGSGYLVGAGDTVTSTGKDLSG